MISVFYRVRLVAVCVFAALLTACASTSPNDPMEMYNRQAYYFTEAMDTVVLKPISHGYHDLVPSPVQKAVANFFSNIGDVWIAFNNFLQGRGDDGFSDVSRILVNTFAGMGGLVDVASDLGLPKHNEDFGQTLGVWGAGPGPYFFIPILGPSDVRDTLAAPADYWLGDPWTHIRNIPVRNAGVVLRAVSKRAALIDAAAVIDDAAVDKYAFIRDAYLQRRQRLVHDRDLKDDEWEKVEPQMEVGFPLQTTQAPGGEERKTSARREAVPPSSPAPANEAAGVASPIGLLQADKPVGDVN
ncbi:MAG: VacJ family lipoprotein [Burkholderiaceae bacterium]|jgi:phospholipid-binding lipoprotein MlaA|nr:VacJ family lipoprotein [Burkholderiaceae bacterium]